MNKKIKSLLNILLLGLVTIIVLYFCLKDNYAAIIKQIVTINKIFLIVGLLLIIGYWLLKSVILHALALRYNKDYSFKSAFRMILEVNFFNAVTPFATGGQPYEIYSLKKHGIKIVDATNIVLQNSIVYQIALVTLGLIAIIYNSIFGLFDSNSALRHLITIGFIVNTLVIVGLFLITYAKKFNHFILNKVCHFLIKIKVIKNPEKTMKKFNKYLEEFHIGANKLLENKKEFMLLIFYHFLSLCLLYLIPLVLILGTDSTISFGALEAILTSAYVMLIGSFVPIPGGTGGLEYGFIQFYGNFIKGPILNAIMLLWRFITYYFGMLLGALVLNIKEKNR